MTLQNYFRDNIPRYRLSTPCLVEYAKRKRRKGIFNDVTIKVANECFPANRMVLSLFSPLFERMFTVEMKEQNEVTVEVKEVDEQSMKSIIDYFYTGLIYIGKQTVFKLLASADYLQLKDVKQYCFEFLIAFLSLKTWFATYAVSVLYHNDYFKRGLRQYLSRNFDDISVSADFKALSIRDVTSIFGTLDRDKVKESSVYQAIIIWTKFDEVNRKMDLPDLLHSVKFSKLHETFCIEIISQEDLITNNYKCMKVAFQGFGKKFNDISKRGEKSKLIAFSKKKKYFEIYNLNESEMENICIPNLPNDLTHFRLSLLNDVVFCIGAKSGEVSTRKAFKFDLKKENHQWDEIASPNELAEQSSFAVFKDTPVVAGGYKYDSAQKVPFVEIYYNALNKWYNIAPMNIARKSFELVNCEGYLYAVGGFSSNHRSLLSVERLCGLDNNWENVQSMITPRKNHAAVSYNGCVYVFGGENDDETLRSVEKYDPVLNEWSYVSNMSKEKRNHAAFVMKGKIYVVGGVDADNKFVTAIESYDPFKDFWSVVGEIAAEFEGSCFTQFLAI